MRTYRQMTRNDRIRMETLLKAGHSKADVARILNYHRSTITREYQRGAYLHRNTDWTETERYSSDLGQKKHDWNMQAKGRALKIGNNAELAGQIEKKIIKEKRSPEAALSELDADISLSTLYRYIDHGIFLKLTNKHLPIKGKKRKKYKKVQVQKRVSAGESIENRPGHIKGRESFGHWEMDTVKGKRNVTKSCLLVLTERKTRSEIVVKLPDQKAASVVEALNRLERSYGSLFPELFKTITVDNGVEFSDCAGMEKSIGDGQRTKVYYCHPFSSWERGSNENNNRLIRRHIPKGTDIDRYTDKEIRKIEDWINGYPRGIFGYRTSAQEFEIELKKLLG